MFEDVTSSRPSIPFPAPHGFGTDLGRARSLAWVATAVMIGLGIVHALLAGAAGVSENALMRLLNLDADQSIMSYYSSALMLVGALGTLAVGLCHRGARSAQARYWLALAAVLLYMSMDEMISLHESIGGVLWRRGLVPESLYFASWLVFGIPVAIVTGAFFLRLLRMIERGLALRLAAAGALFLGGSIGMEIVANALFMGQAPQGFYLLETVVEEGCELLGMTLYVVTILGSLGLSVRTEAR